MTFRQVLKLILESGRYLGPLRRKIMTTRSWTMTMARPPEIIWPHGGYKNLELVWLSFVWTRPEES